VYSLSSVKNIVALILTALFAVQPSMGAPPEGKGRPVGSGQSKGRPAKVEQARGKPDKAGQAKGKADMVGKDKRQETHGPKAKGPAPSASASVGFSDARRLAITYDYIGYQPLPPGIRKQLVRGKPLPPGIAKKAVPPPMIAQLPFHAGYEWRIYGSDLVLVALATGIIADVMRDVFQ
jgi:hypothetical protein